MKNLKRVLALVLAVAMCMTFGITAGAKEFTDQTDVQYTEAVGLLSDLEVVNGYDDGSFNPNGNVTRAEMAKMIYVIMNGEDDGAKNFASVAKFSDVPAGNWAAGYVAYCVSEGVIAGRGNGIFDPASNVTGAEAAKMLLICMGYDADKEGFTGSQWSLNVTNAANKEKLFDGMKGFDANATLTREEAAQMMKNTLLTEMRQYKDNGGWTVTTGDVSISQKAELGYINAGDDSYQTTKTGAKTVLKNYFDNVTVRTGTNDYFGRPATSVQIQGQDVKYYAEDPDTTIKGKLTKKALYDAVGKGVYDEIGKNTGVPATSPSKATLKVFCNGSNVITTPGGTVNFTTAKFGADAQAFMDKSSTANTFLAPKGSAIEVFIDDDTDAVTVCIISNFLVQANGDYSEKNEELKVTEISGIALADRVLSQDDFAVSTYEDEDYIVVTAYTNAAGTAKYIVDSIRPATTVSGIVTGYTKAVAPDADVTIDGTTYEYAGVYANDNADTTADCYTINDEATVITDGKFILFVDDARVSSGNYVYINEAYRDGAASSAPKKADAYFADGNNTTITLNKVLGVNAKDLYAGDPAVLTLSNGGASVAGKWYTYKALDNGEYKLEAIESKYTQATKTVNVTNSGTAAPAVDLIKNGKAALSDTGKILNDKTVFVIIDEDDETNVYTGITNVPTITVKARATAGTNTASAVYLYDGAKVAYVYIDASDDTQVKIDDKSASADDYIFVLKQGSTKTDANDNAYVEYDAIVDGQVQKINVDADADALTAGTLYNKIKVNGKGYISGASAITDGNEYDVVANLGTTASAAQADGTLSIGGSNYLVNADTTIYLVAAGGALLDDADTGYEVSTETAKTLVKALEDYNLTAKMTAIRTDDDEETLVAMYVYVSNTTNAIGHEITVTKSGETYTVSDANLTAAVGGEGGNTLTLTPAAGYTFNANDTYTVTLQGFTGKVINTEVAFVKAAGSLKVTLKNA